MLKTTTTKQPSLVVYDASHPDPETVRRFIVPVIDPEADLTIVAKRVWELANASGSRVQFIGLCGEAVHELEFRRLLATTSAMVNYGSVSASSEIVLGRDWVKNIKSRLRDGDTVICWEKHHTALLHADLGAPIYFIPEIKPGKAMHSRGPARAAAWIGSITILVFFFFIQVEISRLANNWTTLLQLLSVAGEFWLIWLWNSLFG